MQTRRKLAIFISSILLLLLIKAPLFAQYNKTITAFAYRDSSRNTLIALSEIDEGDAYTSKENTDEKLFADLTTGLAKRADRKALMKVLQTLQSNNSSPAVAAKSKLYYKLANVFVHLRLYPLAMKCFLKTKPDSYNQSISALADSAAYNQNPLAVNAVDDSLVKYTLGYKTNEKITYQLIDNAFRDGKKAVAYALLFHVKQPVAGKPKIFKGTNTGHTFITLIKYNTDSSYVSFSFGFYPQKKNLLSATPLIPATASVFKNDSNHESDEVLGKFISKKRFEKILSLTGEYNGLTYHLSKNNCTDFGLKAAGVAGINIEETRGSWPLGSGNNPAITGQSILKGKFTDTDDQTNNSLYIAIDYSKN